MSRLAAGVGLVRAAVGLQGFLAPAAFAGANPLGEADPSTYARYVTRHNGVRELLIGAMTLLPPTRRTGLALGVACDALDVAVGMWAVRDGASPARARLLAAGAAGMAGMGGVAYLRGRPRP